MLTRPQGP
ncbi:hypothetical protein IEO21_09610 [Rhodonia placenta]|uniref:Uncharacterized protein n=1 Tax=Rhodonia placenta TaxID=104341 RepID=A0A8H7TXK5_9APHY|nr:hypothetical protein IEO21_09610 [Postia placenta]